MSYGQFIGDLLSVGHNIINRCNGLEDPLVNAIIKTPDGPCGLLCFKLAYIYMNLLKIIKFIGSFKGLKSSIEIRGVS